jgi:hypothetical protein
MKRLTFVLLAVIFSSQCLEASPDVAEKASQVIMSMADEQVITFDSFDVTIPAGWQHNETSSSQGQMMHIFHQDENSVLKLKVLTAPDNVTRERLRNLTNVDSATSLDWQAWGEFHGYQYEYTENGNYYSQWWLVKERKVILLVYTGVLLDYVDTALIHRIILSITTSDVVLSG